MLIPERQEYRQNEEYAANMNRKLDQIKRALLVDGMNSHLQICFQRISETRFSSKHSSQCTTFARPRELRHPPELG